jgi:acyl-CoA hydrolase
MDNVEFRYRIEKGEVLLFRAEQKRLGKTSVTYNISVFGLVKDIDSERVLFSTTMTFVNVDADDQKQPI